MDAERTTSGRRVKLAAYDALRAGRPGMFVNPPGAAYEILLDPADQERAYESTARRMAARGLPAHYADIGVVYSDPYFTLVRDAVRFRTGDLGTYVRVVPQGDADGAAVLPVLADGRIVLLRQFRHAARAWHWEIPRGFGDPGERGTQTARRELFEELGMPVGELVHLGPLHSDTGLKAGTDQLYLARLEGTEIRSEPGAGPRAEGIDAYRAVSPDAFRALLTEHRITDAYTLAAYALASARGLLTG
ncbi:NUDIX hydrolase [Streptomyces sp. NPDC059166]|uniref:NUDIX hydrolase n=1 Tax=Streptomyces sp. NPDC059166 TaxID=3346752 RepID=UPI0036BA45E4